jgi:hypothetical protein
VSLFFVSARNQAYTHLERSVGPRVQVDGLPLGRVLRLLLDYVAPHAGTAVARRRLPRQLNVVLADSFCSGRVRCFGSN